MIRYAILQIQRQTHVFVNVFVRVRTGLSTTCKIIKIFSLKGFDIDTIWDYKERFIALKIESLRVNR